MNRKPDEIFSSLAGMHDILPGADEQHLWRSENWLSLFDTFRSMTEKYGYHYIDTPEVDRRDLYVRSAGVTSDIVSKELYSWTQGARELSMRPEGSAAVARAVIQSNLVQDGAMGLWYRMPMFRHERQQFGRFRRHVQQGVEIVGTGSPLADVELMQFLDEYYSTVGLDNFSFLINSLGDDVCRPRYIADLHAQLIARRDEYCDDCQMRIDHNPLKVFDCKNEHDRELNKSLPTLREYLCEPCREHHAVVVSQLTVLGISFVEDETLVRGLDYYTRTAFEVVLDDPNSTLATLTGGGRYDKLYSTLGSKPIPAVGFGAGVERLLLALEEQHKTLPVAPRTPAVLVTPTTPETTRAAQGISTRLRSAGVAVSQAFDTEKYSRSLRKAESLGIAKAVIVRAEDVDQGKVLVRTLASREQVVVAIDDLVTVLKA